MCCDAIVKCGYLKYNYTVDPKKKSTTTLTKKRKEKKVQLLIKCAKAKKK